MVCALNPSVCLGLIIMCKSNQAEPSSPDWSWVASESSVQIQWKSWIGTSKRKLRLGFLYFQFGFSVSVSPWCSPQRSCELVPSSYYNVGWLLPVTPWIMILFNKRRSERSGKVLVVFVFLSFVKPAGGHEGLWWRTLSHPAQEKDVHLPE